MMYRLYGYLHPDKYLTASGRQQFEFDWQSLDDILPKWFKLKDDLLYKLPLYQRKYCVYSIVNGDRLYEMVTVSFISFTCTCSNKIF